MFEARSWCLFELLQTAELSRNDSRFLGLQICTPSGVMMLSRTLRVAGREVFAQESVRVSRCCIGRAPVDCNLSLTATTTRTATASLKVLLPLLVLPQRRR